MATATACISIEQYLRTNFRPDAHFVDGTVEERRLGEFEHARLQSLIASFFVVREKLRAIETLTEQRIRVAPSRVRICDIAILHASAPRERLIVTPPLLCIEILSREYRVGRAELVLADYRAMGVAHLWLIDPIQRAAYTFDDCGLHVADPASMAIAGTAIALDLTELFAALN
jgi:Uma2 family endonuclease